MSNQCQENVKKRLHITLPCPVGINQSYGVRRGRGKGLYARREKTDWEAQAALVIRNAAARQNITFSNAPFYLKILFVFSSWRRDIDGPIKTLQDTVSAVLGLNDNNVVHLLVDKRIMRRQVATAFITVWQDGTTRHDHECSEQEFDSFAQLSL